MKNWLARQFALITFSLYTLPRRSRHWWNVRIRKQDLKFSVVKGPLDPTGKIAVVAAFPRSGVEGSVFRLLKFLRNSGYHTILVLGTNKLSDSWEAQLSNEADTVLKRKSMGRDMGAFRAVLLTLRPSIERGEISRIALFNDSAFYTPRSEDFISSYLTSRAQLLSMFTNLQVQPHVQSFAIALGPEILQATWFWKYWSNYFPSNERRPSILKGEILFSRLAFSNGHQPETYVTEQLLESHRSTSESSTALSEIFALERHTFSHGAVGAWAKEKSSQVPGGMTREMRTFLVRQAFGISNPTHSVGLAAARIGAPLKLDLAKAGSVSLGDFLLVLRECGVEENELLKLRGTLEVTGTPVSAISFHKRWRDHGLE